MDITGIIAISGKPGLYKVVAQGKQNIIVESLDTGKRFPAYSTDRVSALDDISIYTHEEDFPLRDVFTAIYEKENGKQCISHKESLNKLVAYLQEILPNYDEDRVYPSDIKKIFQWYNILHKAGIIKLEEKKQDEKEEKEHKKEEEKPKKKPAASTKKKTTTSTPSKGGKTAPQKTTTKKTGAKKTGAKKSSAKK